MATQADPAPPRQVPTPAAGIAARLAALGLGGPVLIVADDDAIAARAPIWAAAFAAAGTVHRVVVPGVDVVAAAAGLGARVVVGAGSTAAGAAARSAATALGIPFVEDATTPC